MTAPTTRAVLDTATCDRLIAAFADLRHGGQSLDRTRIVATIGRAAHRRLVNLRRLKARAETL